MPISACLVSRRSVLLLYHVINFHRKMENFTSLMMEILAKINLTGISENIPSFLPVSQSS